MTRHSRSPANVSIRYVECGGPFDLPHEAYTGGSRNPTAARFIEKYGIPADADEKYGIPADADDECRKLPPPVAAASKGTDDDSWKFPPPQAAASTPEGSDDGSSEWHGTSTSSAAAWSEQPNSQAENQGERRNEHWRAGHDGGRQRYGDRGGQNNWWYSGYYNAKSKGKGYVRAFLATYGPPPSTW